jgi:hypothetical protein
MTFRRLAAVLQRILVIVVLVWSGWYLLLYLYRWEWNRALISGLFFVSAEIAAATSVIVRRLRALEQRLDDVARVTVEPAPEPTKRPHSFAWLRPDQGMFVFVPVLLGVGVILSALAYVVERFAQLTAAPSRGRTAAAFAPLDVPNHRLDESPTATRAHRVREPRGLSVGRVVAVLVTAAVLITFAVMMLMELAQTRPDPSDRPERTVIVLNVDERRADSSPIVAAEALWVACRPRLGGPPRSTANVTALSGDLVQLELMPGLGDTAMRRFTGCLRDATLDLVRANVVDTETFD